MKKRILFLPLTAAVLAACGGGGTTPTTGSGSNGSTLGTVNGTVQQWNGGTSTVSLLARATESVSASNPVLASATLNANGTFALTLPSPATLTPYLSAAGSASDAIMSGGPGCSGSLTNSDPTEQDFAFSVLSAGNTSISSSNVVSSATSASISGRLWLYSTKATTFGGSVRCTDTSGGYNDVSTVSLNAALVQGWNVLALTGSVSASQASNTVTSNLSLTLASDAPSSWYLPQVGSMSLGAQRAAAHFAVTRARFGKLMGGHLNF